MKLLRRSSSKGGRSKPDEGCKRHPKHRQSPGVCSLCLVDKLSKLPSPPHCTSTIRTATKLADSNCSPSSSSSSLSSPCSSASDSALYSSSSSPMHRYRFGKDRGAGSSFSLLWFSGKNLLTKSRSVAFVSRIENNGYDDDKKKKKKINGGFLSKLIH